MRGLHGRPGRRFVAYADVLREEKLVSLLDQNSARGCATRDGDSSLSIPTQKYSPVRTYLALILAMLCGAFFSAPISRAQAGPVEGEAEYQVFTSGGHGINGSQMDDGVFNIGARFGLILTAPHGPGFLKGRLEYALDVLPLYCVTQANGTACGGGVDPFAFKWILSTPKKVAPYFEIGGGTLFTDMATPPKTSQINFTTGGALGMHFLQSKHNISAEFRFQHISNAGMTKPNPGINTIQLRIGFGWFSQKR